MMTQDLPETEHLELQRRNRELSILNSIAQALHRETDLDQALHVVLAQVADLFGLRTGWIFLVHAETDESYLAAEYNLPPGLVDEPELMMGDCYCLDTYHAGDLAGAANVNIITCTRLQKLITGSEGLRYHATIPLYAQERKLGVLNVASTDWRKLSKDDLRLLYIVGDLLSIAIERAQLFAQSVQLGAVEERNRLAREIHDTLAQGLSAITLHLETADALLEMESTLPQVRQSVQQALLLSRRNLDEARRSVMDLRAAPLEGCTLVEALELLMVQCNSHFPAKDTCIDFRVEGDNRPLPLHLEVGLYRIAHEALNNALDHACAQQICLMLRLLPEEVSLQVRDDGQGFDPTQVPEGHFGLIGMNERAKLLGGELKLESSLGVGTEVAVAIPLT